ncbi:MAG TPA: immunoglobulin-like domain-containing protein, partial [Candidatus Sulfotelmatobacter sp.]|nr:immunoglobulin-like domain-containing protein [Candidatus Sulfotelmatobacter sp.]
ASLPDLTGTNYILATDSGSSAGLTITQSPTNGAALALGTNQVVLTVSDSSHNLAWSTNCIVVADTTPPVITVLGPNPINVRLRSNFVDPGATALDNCSGLVSLRTNNLVDIKDAGTYTIEYVASDALGNTATNTRIVTVVDTPGPLIVWSFNTLIIKAAPNSIVQMPDVTGTNYLLVDYITTTPLPTIQSRTNGSVLARGTNQVILQVSGMLGSKPRTVYSTNWVVVTDTAAPVSAAPQIQALLPATRLAPPVLKDGTCQLSFSGPTGQTYQVLAGQDLAQPLSGWTVLTNGVFSAGAETFTDTSVTNCPTRFYRLVSP